MLARRSPCCSLTLTLLLFHGLVAVAPVDADADTGAPSTLSIAFEPNATQLPATAIDAAIRAELARSADAEPATGELVIGLLAGKLVLSFTPRPQSQVRMTEVPANADDIPAVVALLAGNLIRDQAAALLRESPAVVPLPSEPAGAPAIAATPTVPVAPTEPEQPQDEREASPWPVLRVSLLARGVGGGDLKGPVGGAPQPGIGFGLRAEVSMGYFGAGVMLSHYSFGLSEAVGAELPGSGSFTDVFFPLKLQLPIERSPLELALYVAPGITLAGELTHEDVPLRGSSTTATLPLDVDLGYALGLWLGGSWFLSDHLAILLEVGMDWHAATVGEGASVLDRADQSRFELAISGGAPLHSVSVVQAALNLGLSYRF
jgi:hypothetical protein